VSAVHEWVVAGALIEAGDALLLVRNLRRNGRSDWTTPGGVIDAADASIVAGLTREVEEETGLLVTQWEGPVYEVHCVAEDLGWTLRAEIHRALEYEGELRVEDPDGIVVEAAFFTPGECRARLGDAGSPWVHEPLDEWLAERWGPDGLRGFRYDVRGTRRDELSVRRTDR
jgi:8-oxo-dGTP diphosphatase